MNCQKCNGSGLMIREIDFICSNNHVSTSNCYRCERKDKSKYIVCKYCNGTGYETKL
jgi:DnaJ-class molecular chaperone